MNLKNYYDFNPPSTLDINKKPVSSFLGTDFLLVIIA